MTSPAGIPDPTEAAFRHQLEVAIAERPPCVHDGDHSTRLEWACCNCDVDAAWPLIRAEKMLARAEFADENERLRNHVEHLQSRLAVLEAENKQLREQVEAARAAHRYCEVHG